MLVLVNVMRFVIFKGDTMSEGKNKFDITVRISDDYYKAFVSLEFHSSDQTVKPDEIIKILKDKNIENYSNSADRQKVFELIYNTLELNK